MTLKSLIALLGVAVNGLLLHWQNLNAPPSVTNFGMIGLAASQTLPHIRTG